MIDQRLVACALLIHLRRPFRVFLGPEPFRHLDALRFQPVAHLAPNLGRAVVAGGQDTGKAAAKVCGDSMGPGHRA